MSPLPSWADVAEVVRLPAVLSVPGDVLAGAAATGWVGGARRAALSIGASSCLYLAGMALNDYADRDVDAEERPARPIPSGRVTPRFALGLATGLTATGVGLAVAAAGPSGLAIALPLTATVWGYDLRAKDTVIGPAAMAGARFLNVLMGSGPTRSALSPAAVVAAHTAVITTVSRREVEGAHRSLGTAALAGSSGVAVAAAALSLRRGVSRPRALASAVFAGGYLAVQGRAAAAARRDPTPSALQRFVGSGVLGFIPLDAALLAPTAPVPITAAVAAAWPLARRFARRRSVT